MPKVVFNDDEVLEVNEMTPLKEICEDAGVPFACEEGICGTCVVEVEEGMENLTKFTEEEVDFLGEQDLERLACQCSVKCGEVKLKF